MTGKNIVVTGATGFIAKHVISGLLETGYRVRATMRNLKRAEEVRRTVADMAGDKLAAGLELFECDLLMDGEWERAFGGCDALIHMAARVPIEEPGNPESVIRPSLEGTERVLDFAIKAGIRRVVMTSSIAAIGYGHGSREKSLDLGAGDWTNIKGLKGGWAYARAKTLAEKRAWEMAGNGRLDLTTICPSMVFGPVPDIDTSASLEVVRRLMNGEVPALPPGGISVVDVRDVARIHVGALEDAVTFNQRIIASAQYIAFSEIAEIIKTSYPEAKIPKTVAPVWALKVAGIFSRSIRQIAADLRVVRNYDGSGGRRLLDGGYRNGREAVLSAAESMIELGLIGIRP